jgi:hypothetical protein
MYGWPASISFWLGGIAFGESSFSPTLDESGMSGRCVSAPLFLESMEWNN